jgi:curved DNA-binding protein CbpA
MDPYAVLGVEATADAGSIRKSYWRLSLLVHPDKCRHPAAQEVFQAVSKAAQLLQDAQQRAAHDAAQADAALRQQAVAAAAAAEREIAWRKARGEAVPGELAAVMAAAQAAQPAARDTWMTDLPTQQDRSAASVLAAGLSQVCCCCCAKRRLCCRSATEQCCAAVALSMLAHHHHQQSLHPFG